MSVSSSATLEDVIRLSGEGWIIDWFVPREKAIDHIRDTIASVSCRAKERFGDRVQPPTEEVLVDEYRRNPARMRGFFQALGGTRTPDMLLMVWRIIQGMEIKEVRLDYQRALTFELRVVIKSPGGEEDKPYVSDNIHDFALFRHIGILEIDNRPVFDGFYALRIRES
jgi:hypothetical protein